jgi:hypothetical protein
MKKPHGFAARLAIILFDHAIANPTGDKNQ